MSLIIQCTSGHRMTVSPEYQGKRVRCPQCQEILTVPVQGGAAPPAAYPAPPRPADDMGRHVRAPAPPPGYDPEPQRAPPRERGWDERRDDRRDQRRDDRWNDRDDYDRRGDYGGRRDDYRDRDRDYGQQRDDGLDREEIGQLQSVSVGLGFAYFRYLFGIFVLLLLGAFIGMRIYLESLQFQRIFGGRRSSAEDLLEVLMVVDVIAMAVLGLVAAIFTFVGTGLCCRTPSRGGGMALPLTSLMLDLVASVLGAIVLIMVLANLDRRPSDGVLGIIFILSAAGFLFFVISQALFCAAWYRLGHFVHAEGSARLAMGSMIVWLIVQVLFPILIIVLAIIAADRRPGPNNVIPILALVALGVWIVISIVILALFMGALSGLRRRIRAETSGFR